MRKTTFGPARLAACLALAVATLVPARSQAQCYSSGMPTTVLPGAWMADFQGDVLTVNVFGGGQRLAVGSTNGFGIFSLASPMSPAPLQLLDIRDQLGLGTCVSTPTDPCDPATWSVAGSPDGKTIIAGTIQLPGDGVVVATSPDSTTYTIHGQFPSSLADVAVQGYGTRTIGYSMTAIGASPTGTPVLAAELTGATSGPASTSLASETSPAGGGSINPLADLVRVRGPWIVVQSNFSIYFMDAHQPGAPGSITTGMQVYGSPSLPVPSDEQLQAFDAVVDPTDSSATPRVYVIVILNRVTDQRLVFRLLKFEGGQLTTVGQPFMPDGDFGNTAYMALWSVGAIAVGTDVTFLMWSSYSTELVRLYTNSLAHWGYPPAYMEFDVNDVPGAVQMSLANGTGSEVYAYLATGDDAIVLPMVCDNAIHAVDGGMPAGDAATGDAAAPTADAGCVIGAACTSADGCQTGKMACTGTPTCASLVNKADGTACGAGGTCQAGVCKTCTDGDPCDGPTGCTRGVLSCAGGVPTCVSLTGKADGESCGANKVCFGGECSPCTAGGKCTSVDGCQTGKVSCATGQPTCDAPWTNQTDGTVCSGTGTCQAGVCSSCTNGAVCDSQNGCQEGTVSCSGGAVCKNFKDKADGTICKGGVCKTGACVGCVANLPCETDDGCMSGTMECSGGTPKCSHLAAKSDGAACPGGTCYNGMCKVPADAGAVVRLDASATAGDTGPAADVGKANGPDTGLAGSAPPSGCGCQSGIGGAWTALAAATGAMLLRRRRR